MSKKDRQSEPYKKRTDNRSRKGPTIAARKEPTNYLPVTIECVVDGCELNSLLHRFNQGAWASRKRISGLLLLIDFIIRKGGQTLKISSELSHEYVRRLKGVEGTKAQPLALLVHIGILEIVRPAKVGPHLKVSTEYRIHRDHPKRFRIEIHVSPQQRAKLDNADIRNETRNNRKHPFRARLRLDMERLGLSSDGQSKALRMMVAHEKEPSVLRAMEFLNQTRERAIRVDGTGTVNTFINSIPRELKPYLEIDGKPVSKCDIEGAHFCILQRIVRDRMEYLRKSCLSGHKMSPLEDELGNLAQMIEAGDIYSQGRQHITTKERKASKRTMLSALNMKTSVALHISEYQWLRTKFPRTFGIVEDIKKGDHRALSIQLRNYTARIINGALTQLQAIDIPAFPDTDALIVTKEHGTPAREAIERFLREVAGAGKVSVT